MTMAGHVLVILQQGIWASATGGWFFDAHQNIFSNTFHLYVWLFLLCLPMMLYMVSTSDAVSVGELAVYIVVKFSTTANFIYNSTQLNKPPKRKVANKWKEATVG